MAKFCAQCGAPLDDDARFCGECGARVEGSVQTSGPVEAAIPEVPLEEPVDGTIPPVGDGSQEENGGDTGGAIPEEKPLEEAATEEVPTEEPAQWTAPQEPQQTAQPREKKPLPKWTKPVGIAVAAVVVVLVALSLILKSVNGPESVADKFLDALAKGDFAAFSKVAVVADEDLTLTEENTAPLFKLYSESIAFRKSVEEMLDEDIDLIEDGDAPNEGYLFDLRGEKKFLHTGYKVIIETCDTLEISGNLACDVTLDGGQTASLASDSSAGTWGDSEVLGPDYSLIGYSSGVVYDLLPGLYTVTGTVTTSSGTTFTAETQVEVSNEYNAYAELDFTYTTMEVRNHYDIPVEFYLDGNLYGSMDGEGYFEMGPLNPDQMIEARTNVDTGESISETFSASEGYWTLSFIFCDVEINNEYAAPILVVRDGVGILEVPPLASSTIEDLPSGTVLTMELYEGITEPVEYTCESEFDYIYPEFTLPETIDTDLLAAVQAYIEEVAALFNGQDLAGLQTVTATDLSDDMISTLEELERQVGDMDDLGSMSFALSLSDTLQLDNVWLPSYWEVDADLEGHQIVALACYLPLKIDLTINWTDDDPQSETQEGNEYYEFQLEYVDGAWNVIG